MVLILFNDPIYAFTLYKPSLMLVTATTLSIVLFLSWVIYFWLVYFERIYAENDLKSCKVDKKWKKSLTYVSSFRLENVRC